MTRWSWVIDQRKCVGCHACTTACKSENDVAVGVFRTWVKNVDVGTYPDVRRQFAVLRCNHCEDAPCVEICPVTAMYQRPDGLVDFAEDRCIGCKACMQACPYDAIHIDPATHTAKKCNFCSHRVDEGLLPACVVVCPVEALVFGDLDDPTSRVAKELANVPAKVRRPEQRTKPKAFYLGADPATLDPLASRQLPIYMWSDRVAQWPSGPVADDRAGPPGHRATVSYDIPKPTPWQGKVSSYIWTKSLAAGLGFIPAVLRLYGLDISPPLLSRITPLLALAFLAITGLLLIADLKRPERFWTILVRPQWRSWLARGAFVITAYGAVLTAWTYATWTGSSALIQLLAVPVAVLALLTGVYTAFLFAQCEGRDLWQSRLLGLHLGTHVVIAGLSALMIAAPLAKASALVGGFASWLGGALVLSVLLALVDVYGKHRTANAEAAAEELVRGADAARFWSSLGIGALVPALLLWFAPSSLHFLAAPVALIGLWHYGHAYVMAGQRPPIS